MFAPITLHVRRAAVIAAVAVIALSLPACSASPEKTTASNEASTVDFDYCPNLPDVHDKEELPDTYEQVYSAKDGIRCLPTKEAKVFIAEMDRQYQEQVAKATLQVLGPQSAKMTEFDKLAKSVAYYCNHPGDINAEITARLVYGANYVAPTSVGNSAYDGFNAAAKAVCPQRSDVDTDTPLPYDLPSEQAS